MLGAIVERTGGLDLSMLETAPREEAIDLLESLPGVGRKTTACVLLFSYDRPELPVDTHVYRVSSRLELIRPKAPFLEAHDVMRGARAPGRRSTSCTSTCSATAGVSAPRASPPAPSARCAACAPTARRCCAA